MTRSGYTDYCEWGEDRMALFERSLLNAIEGRRGQALLAELADALDAMPDKILISHALQDTDGAVCTLGCIAKRRGIEVPITPVDEDFGDEEDEEWWLEFLADRLKAPKILVRELVYENDECRGVTPAERWQHMRKWVAAHIKKGEERE